VLVRLGTPMVKTEGVFHLFKATYTSNTGTDNG